MATATLTAPSITPTPRASRTNANRKAFDRAIRCWADALIALRRAVSASEVFTDALNNLAPAEMDSIDGEDLRHDLWHISWAMESHVSLLEGPAPGDVTRMVRAAS